MKRKLDSIFESNEELENFYPPKKKRKIDLLKNFTFFNLSKFIDYIDTKSYNIISKIFSL
jgi:hypothetical protein